MQRARRQLDSYSSQHGPQRNRSNTFLLILCVPAVAFFAFTAFSETPEKTKSTKEKNLNNGFRICDENDPMLARHNNGIVEIRKEFGELLCFSKYVSFFDTRKSIFRNVEIQKGIPYWVVQKVKKWDQNLTSTDNGIQRSENPVEGRRRPAQWFHVPSIKNTPTDDSYRFTRSFRSQHSNWYERGHLAQKFLAERPPYDPKIGESIPEGAGAGWFTHNVANAVPQRGQFNRGPWLALECYTGAWANKYEQVWIVSGPVFVNGRPTNWIESDLLEDATAIAVPDALFKIVFRKARDKDAAKWHALAFLYPQESDAYQRGPWPPANWLTSIKQIEKLTDIDFSSSPDSERALPKKIWPVSIEDFDPSCRRFAPENSL